LVIGGYSFSFTLCDQISASVSLSKDFDFQSGSVRCNIDIPFGSMTGTFTTAATFASDLEASSISMGLSASQGLFSGGLSVGISQQQDTLRLSSVSTNFGMTLTPVRISVSVLFGRTGLRQAAFDVGVTF
jgi:carbon monoxide dehydrogenase subunit G